MKSIALNLTFIVAGAALIQLAACKKTETNTDPKSGGDAGAASAKADPQLFADTYLHALQNKDTPKLDSMMLTDGVPAETLEFFKMLREEPAEGTTMSVEVMAVTQADLDKFGKEQEMPDGKMYKMPMAPSHVMKVTTETKGEGGDSTGNSSMPIGEKDGRFVILLPVPVS